MIELLVVIAIIAILAALLLPVMSKVKVKAEAVACMSNGRQLMLGWLMFANQNDDTLMPASQWVAGSMDSQTTTGSPWTVAESARADLLVDRSVSLMAPYIPNPNVYKCPADKFQSAVNPVPRVRSYSMNAACGGNVGTIGGTYNPDDPATPRNYIKDTSDKKMSILDKPGPVNVWVMLDEHPDSISDATFQFRPGYPPTAYQWQDMPASLHNGSCCLSFADGHSEIHKWFDGRTLKPVRMLFKWWQSPGAGTYSVGIPKPSSVDYEWMDEGMAYQ